jgi:hypothetical protein
LVGSGFGRRRGAVKSYSSWWLACIKAPKVGGVGRAPRNGDAAVPLATFGDSGGRTPYDEAVAVDPHVVFYRISGHFLVGSVLDRISDSHRLRHFRHLEAVGIVADAGAEFPAHPPSTASSAALPARSVSS